MNTNTLEIILCTAFVIAALVWCNADVLARMTTRTSRKQIIENDIIMCECGHQLEEHDWNGCSVMTVEVKSNDFARVVTCHCTLTPQNIIEGKSNG